MSVCFEYSLPLFTLDRTGPGFVQIGACAPGGKGHVADLDGQIGSTRSCHEGSFKSPSSPVHGHEQTSDADRPVPAVAILIVNCGFFCAIIYHLATDGLASPDGRRDTFNPAGMLLAALATGIVNGIVNGIARVIPLFKFQLHGVTVHLHGVHQDVPLKMASINYAIVVDSDAAARRVARRHDKARRFGSVSPGTDQTGRLRRQAADDVLDWQ